MSKRAPLLTIDKPAFQVKLHSDLLEIDLKEGARKELEDLAEARPVLRESVGWLFQTIIPLDVELHEIDKVEVDHDGKVKLVIPGRRDISIPLDASESRKLVEKLNQLIPTARQRFFEKSRVADSRRKEVERQVSRNLAPRRQPRPA